MIFDKRLSDCGYFIAELTSKNVRELLAKLPPHNAIAICDSGEIVIENNMQPLRLTKGTRVMVSPVMQSEVRSMSADVHVWLFGMTKEYGLEVSCGLPANQISAIFTNPVRLVKSDDELAMMANIMKSMWVCNNMPGVSHAAEVTALLMRSLLTILIDVENRDYSEDDSNTGRTMGETYFREFLRLIDNHVDTEHEVAFYASKLKITPKYLSEICKSKAQHKAKEIIASILATRIKYDITMSNASMKSLAVKYNFADQSSLGKFFRKIVGVSPSDYRNKSHQAANE